MKTVNNHGQEATISNQAFLEQLAHLDKLDVQKGSYDHEGEREAIIDVLVRRQAHSKSHALFQLIRAVNSVSQAQLVLSNRYDQPSKGISATYAAEVREECVDAVNEAKIALWSVFRFIRENESLGALPINPDLYMDILAPKLAN